MNAGRQGDKSDVEEVRSVCRCKVRMAPNLISKLMQCWESTKLLVGGYDAVDF